MSESIELFYIVFPLLKKLFQNILQISQEDTCAGTGVLQLN